MVAPTPLFRVFQQQLTAKTGSFRSGLQPWVKTSDGLGVAKAETNLFKLTVMKKKLSLRILLLAIWVLIASLSKAQKTITASIAWGSNKACLGSASASPYIQQFTVAGSSLTATIIVTAPANFEVSNTAASGYSGYLQIEWTGGTVSSTKIYVRSAATASGSTITPAFAYVVGSILIKEMGVQKTASEFTATNGTTITLNYTPFATSFSLKYTKQVN